MHVVFQEWNNRLFKQLYVMWHSNVWSFAFCTALQLHKRTQCDWVHSDFLWQIIAAYACIHYYWHTRFLLALTFFRPRPSKLFLVKLRYLLPSWIMDYHLDHIYMANQILLPHVEGSVFDAVGLWFFLFAYEISRKMLNGFVPYSHWRH